MTRALPDPLVPAEVDLRDFQYMELDVQMLRDSRFAAEADAEAFRAGVLLWCAAWHQVPAGSLPNNDIELSNLAGYGRVVKEWKKVRAQALSSFVECSDGRLYHPVIAGQVLEMIASRSRGWLVHREAVIARCGHRCWYCGCDGVDLTLDHVMPRSRGGADDPENLVPACRPCNSSKGARTPEEWRGRF